MSETQPEPVVQNVNDLIIVSSVEMTYNIHDWNCIQNTYNSKVADPEKKFPKYLLIRAWQEFVEWCKLYHVDWRYYQFVNIWNEGCVWQVDFQDTAHPTQSCKGSVFHIYYDSRNKRILQREISME